jgi:hypothetical protein
MEFGHRRRTDPGEIDLSDNHAARHEELLQKSP